MRKALLWCCLFVLLVLSVNAQKVRDQKAESIPAGKYIYYSYEYTQTTRLWGRFRATGGKNDVQCLILDADGFENFKNGNQYQYYYDSGRVTVATFDKTLAKGSYYLVFNNSWSLLTPKAVTISWYE